jgi:hypothetical protein
MTVIHVPRPSKNAMNPERPVNALLQAQIQHLQKAENNLPLKYCSDKYINAIRTEGEAGEYIRHVTEAIHQAHEDAAAQRAKRAGRQKKGLTLAAAAERPRRKRRAKAKAINNNRKRGKK